MKIAVRIVIVTLVVLTLCSCGVRKQISTHIDTYDSVRTHTIVDESTSELIEVDTSKVAESEVIVTTTTYYPPTIVDGQLVTSAKKSERQVVHRTKTEQTARLKKDIQTETYNSIDSLSVNIDKTTEDTTPIDTRAGTKRFLVLSFLFFACLVIGVYMYIHKR